MPAAKRTSIPSDSRRDAEKYHNLLLAIESATGKISALEQEGRAGIDEVLESFLPNLVEALNAAQSFVAVYRQDKRSRAGRFDLVAVHPKLDSNKSFLPWSRPLEQVLLDGRARVVEPFEDAPTKFISGLEIFRARTAVLTKMEVGNQTRIVGVCNRYSPEAGPFLAADRRALASVIELIAIGLRVGERRRQELENIQNISAAINAEIDLNKLLPLIAQKAAEVFSAPAASLMLWDKSGQSLIIEASHGLTVEYVKRQRIPRKKAEAAIAAAGNARTILTPDLRKRPFGRADLIKAERLCSALSAQLRVSGEMIGILNVYSKDVPRVFTEDEVHLAEIFANHAEIAIHKARLRQRELDSLLATSDALEATLDEDELLQLIAWKVHGVFNAPVSLIFRDETNGNLIVKASYGLPDDFARHTFTARDKMQTMGRDRKDSKPFVIEDLRLAAYSLQDVCRQENLFNALAVPLVPSGTTEAIGFLVVYGKYKPRIFTNEDMKIAGMLASQAAIAVRTTRLHGQNKLRGEQLNALDQIALAILNTGTNCGFKLELFGSLVRLANDHPTSTYTRDVERNSLSSL